MSTPACQPISPGDFTVESTSVNALEHHDLPVACCLLPVACCLLPACCGLRLQTLLQVVDMQFRAPGRVAFNRYLHKGAFIQ